MVFQNYRKEYFVKFCRNGIIIINNYLYLGRAAELTQEELKKLDKRIQAIRDPFGSGLQIFRKLLWDAAEDCETSGSKVLQSYIDWKFSKK